LAISETGLVATGRAIAERRRGQEERDRDRGLSGLIEDIDAVLDGLEQLHLLDQHRVPASYAARLEHLSASLPADVRCDLPTGTTIARLMETLYAIQGKLMSRRSGRTGDPGRDDTAPRTPPDGWYWSGLR
jgi:hypothetical protein